MHDEEVEVTGPSATTPRRFLWVLRHGKAASEAPWGGSDRERPLSARGRRDATALGGRLGVGTPLPGLEDIPPPAHVICSAAVRTRQTADLVVSAMGGDPPLEAYRSLYGADTDVALRYIHEIDNRVASALLVGHNPTMLQLAWELLSGPTDDEPSHDRSALEARPFTTCALAVFGFSVYGWDEVQWGTGRLIGLFTPPY
jgi:phosphohistidine phosphatase